MGRLLSYSMTAAMLMLAMHLIYRLFLARENQHGYNRGILLLIYFLSFAAKPIASVVESTLSKPGIQEITLSDIEIVNSENIPHSQPVWATILIWIFLAGMLLFTIKTAITWIRLVKIIRSGEKIKRDGYTLVIADNEKLAPFSWINYMVVSRADYETDNMAIAIHECKHIASRHWIDLMVAQIACIINWFNPAAWLMRDELMLVHEYQADMAVIDSGFDARQYQMILIRKAVGPRFPSLANSLNHSKLKKRITMMHKAKSSAGRKLKALALVPTLALALGVAAAPAVRAAVSTISSSDLSVGKVSENSSLHKTDVVVKAGTIAKDSLIVVSAGTIAKDTAAVDGEYIATSNSRIDKKVEVSTQSERMIIYLDGKEIAESEMNELSPSDIESIKVNKQKDVILIRMKNSSLKPEDVIIYLDGKEITKSEMNELAPSDIESITVNKQENVIMIKMKK